MDGSLTGHAVNDTVRLGGTSFARSAGRGGITHRVSGSGSDAWRLLLPAGCDDLGGELTLHDGEEIAVVIAEDEVELLDVLVRL